MTTLACVPTILAGLCTVTGRANDVNIRGSHNIDPGLVEDAFLAHPRRGDVRGGGRAGRAWGEVAGEALGAIAVPADFAYAD